MSLAGSNTVGAAPTRDPRLAHARSWLLPAVFITILGGAWFCSIGLRSLISPDEGRYATLSLGMLQSGDWITPRLNGLLYFEKPVLQYWLGAIAFNFLGVSEFSARLWPALAGFLTVLATGFTAARLWGRESGLQALAICGSMTWILGNSLYLTLDAGLTLWLTIALCSVLLARRTEVSAKESRNWILLAWVAIALAVLTKGLVGIVIPGATLVLLCLWQRNWSWWRGMHWLPGSVLFLAITAPWFVAVSSRNPGFAEFFFIHEHFARFLTKVHRREGAWWYYIPLLLAGALPWTGLVAALAPRLWRDVFAPVKAVGEESLESARVAQQRALVAWSAFTFAFFSLSGSKLPSYILPMFPALALLMSIRARELSASSMRWNLWILIGVWLLAVLVSTQAHRFAGPNSPVSVLEPMAHAIRMAAGIFAAGAAIAWFCLRQSRVTAAILSLALSHVLALVVVLGSHDSFGQLKSAEIPAKRLQSYVDAATPVFAVRSYDQTLPFYLRRNVVLVEYEDEFEMGQRLEPNKSIARLEDFLQRWSELPKAAAYMTPATWQELQQRRVPMRVVYQDPRRVVVVKP